MANSTITIPTTKPEIDSLIRFGLLLESLTYDKIPMKEALQSILDNKINITSVLSSAGFHLDAHNAEEKFHVLNALLDTLPYDNRGWKMSIGYVFITLATMLVVGLRLYERKYISKRIRPEDWCAAIALSWNISIGIMYLIAVLWGRGTGHIYAVSFQKFQQWLVVIGCCLVGYALALIPLRFCYLIFYFGIYPDRTYRRWLIFVGVLTVAWSFEGIFMFLFWCKPVNYWDHYFTAKCMDRVLLSRLWGAFTIMLDFFLLFIPIWKVCKMNLRRKEKVLILAIFGSGGIVCVAAIGRVITFVDVLQQVDMMYHISTVSVWSLVEIDLALMITCIPALRHFFVGHRTIEPIRRSQFMSFPSKFGMSFRRRNPPGGILPQQKQRSPDGSTGFSTVATEVKTHDSMMVITTIEANTSTRDVEKGIEEFTTGRRESEVIQTVETDSSKLKRPESAEVRSNTPETESDGTRRVVPQPIMRMVSFERREST